MKASGMRCRRTQKLSGGIAAGVEKVGIDGGPDMAM